MRETDDYRLLAALLPLTVAVVNLGCAQWWLHQKESHLREALLVMGSEIAQFMTDKQQPPTSLTELVTAGYMKQIPADPFTGKNDPWKIEKGADSLQVRSGSSGIAGDGTPSSSW